MSIRKLHRLSPQDVGTQKIMHEQYLSLLPPAFKQAEIIEAMQWTLFPMLQEWIDETQEKLPTEQKIKNTVLFFQVLLTQTLTAAQTIVQKTEETRVADVLPQLKEQKQQLISRTQELLSELQQALITLFTHPQIAQVIQRSQKQLENLFMQAPQELRTFLVNQYRYLYTQVKTHNTPQTREALRSFLAWFRAHQTVLLITCGISFALRSENKEYNALMDVEATATLLTPEQWEHILRSDNASLHVITSENNEIATVDLVEAEEKIHGTAPQTTKSQKTSPETSGKNTKTTQEKLPPTTTTTETPALKEKKPIQDAASTAKKAPSKDMGSTTKKEKEASKEVTSDPTKKAKKKKKTPVNEQISANELRNSPIVYTTETTDISTWRGKKRTILVDDATIVNEVTIGEVAMKNLNSRITEYEIQTINKRNEPDYIKLLAIMLISEEGRSMDSKNLKLLYSWETSKIQKARFNIYKDGIDRKGNPMYTGGYGFLHVTKKLHIDEALEILREKIHDHIPNIIAAEKILQEEHNIILQPHEIVALWSRYYQSGANIFSTKILVNKVKKIYTQKAKKKNKKVGTWSLFEGKGRNLKTNKRDKRENELFLTGVYQGP